MANIIRCALGKIKRRAKMYVQRYYDRFPFLIKSQPKGEKRAVHISAFSYGNAGDTLLPVVLRDLFNDTIGINIAAWFTGIRLLALHLVWILLVFSLYITNPQTLIKYLRLWAILSLFSAFWTWKMIHIGLTDTETAWLYSPGNTTHLLNAGTLIRYWSTFNDAATYGCNASASAVAFLIFGITS